MASASSSRKDGGDSDGEPTHHDRSFCCFQEWMQTQQQDLSRLLESAVKNGDPPAGDDDISDLVQNCVTRFQDYISKRNHLAEDDVSPFFPPTWCTSLENSLLWIAGCRPSIFIRLIYAPSGAAPESRLTDLLQDTRSGNLRAGNLSPEQFIQLDSLRMKTTREEEKLTGEMASFHEDIADEPLAVIANKMDRVGEANEDADKALEEHGRVMRGAMQKADELRLNTLKELVRILTPVQAVELLVASKKLHLSLHQWRKWGDQKNGRGN